MEKLLLLLGFSAQSSLTEIFWKILGYTAQSIFFSRFLVQWIASERAGKSVVPISFWFLSILGGVLLLFYAIWRRDPVFILGQSAGVVIYVRNLFLIRKGRARERVYSGT